MNRRLQKREVLDREGKPDEYGFNVRGFPKLEDLHPDDVSEARLLARVAGGRLPNGFASGLLTGSGGDNSTSENLTVAIALIAFYVRRRMTWEARQRIEQRKKELGQ